MSNPFRYFFRYNNDTVECTHAEYLANEGLCEAVRDADKVRLFAGRSVFVFDMAFLKDKPKLVGQLELLEKELRVNPLRFYAPNSQEQLDFINDDEATVCALVDLNRSGKTTAAWIKMMVGPNPMIKADPSWECFTDHGLKYHDFIQPISCGVATYNTAKLEDPIWKEMIKKWTPDDELGRFRRFDRKRNSRYSPNWGHDKHIQFDKSQSQIGFYTYESDQGNFEGGALKKWLWDEQGKKAMWNGADRGTRTTNGVHYFSLTPHAVDGRPDTGASGWLYPFLTGQEKMGHTVNVYHGTDITDIPDWIYPEKQKQIEIEKWEREPLRIQETTGVSQRKVLAEGRARLYGEWHMTTDTVLDEWQPEYSWIDPLWDVPPKDVTLYRGIDHGINAPTVCLWFAVDREQNIYLYRSYYNKGLTIGENVRKIIELSGNERAPLGQFKDHKSGIIFERFQEVYRREFITKQVMDGRSFSLPDKMCGKPHGWIYKQAGLRSIQQASGKFSAHWIPMFQELLHVDETRMHPVTKKMGAPRLYVFNKPENTPFKYEIEHYFWKRSKEGEAPKDTPEKKNDHGINAAAYAIQIPLVYMGSPGGKERIEGEEWYDQQEVAPVETEEDYRRIG